MVCLHQIDQILLGFRISDGEEQVDHPPDFEIETRLVSR